MRRLAAPLVALLLCASCTTRNLWDATNPRELVAMPRSDATRAYIREHDLRFREDPEWDLIYVEKTDLRKFGDYTART